MAISRPGADQVAQPVLDLLLAIGDQLLLDRKVVVDGLLGDLGLACHVGDGDVLVAALGEQAASSVGDELAGARLLELAQCGAGAPQACVPAVLAGLELDLTRLRGKPLLAEALRIVPWPASRSSRSCG